jgi:hypothetical protein
MKTTLATVEKDEKAAIAVAEVIVQESATYKFACTAVQATRERREHKENTYLI